MIGGCSEFRRCCFFDLPVKVMCRRCTRCAGTMATSQLDRAPFASCVAIRNGCTAAHGAFAFNALHLDFSASSFLAPPSFRLFRSSPLEFNAPRNSAHTPRSCFWRSCMTPGRVSESQSRNLYPPYAVSLHVRHQFRSEQCEEDDTACSILYQLLRC